MDGSAGSALACHDKLSGFESRHPSKIRPGRHKQMSGQHTLARQNNNLKKNGKRKQRKSEEKNFVADKDQLIIL
jgi:hypothetical protein